MKRGCMVGVIVLAVVLIALLVTALVMDRRYELLFASGRIPHEQLASPDMGLRVSIQPTQAGDYLYNIVKRKQPNVPQWALLRILPYEAAFMLEPKGDSIQSTFYVNAQRLGPQVASYIREANLASQLSFVQWESPVPEARERGVLVMHGTLAANTTALDYARLTWREFTPSSSLPLEGNHFVEAVLDNRAGSGFITLASVLAANGVPDDQLGPESLLATLAQTLTEARVTADIVDGNEVDLTVRLVYRDEGLQEQATTIKFVYDMAFGRISQYLTDTFGAELDGAAGWDGSTLLGRYRLKDMDRLLGM